MPRRPKSEAFDVKLTPEQKVQLTADFCREIEDALSARAQMIGDGGLIDLYDWFYEQGRSNPEDRPFVGAADLTSYIFTENVDSLRARMLDTVVGAEPFCIVDGWGEDAKKAPLVEAFHEWQVDEEGLFDELTKVVHGGLLEDCYVLEVRERVETRRITEVIDAALEASEEGGAIFDPNARPKIRFDEDGEPVLAKQGESSVKVERTYTKTKRLGPEYDAISMKDFVYLPGHAKNQRQVRGYAYRFWSRVPEIQEKAEDGIYDREAVKLLGDETDRDLTESPNPSTTEIAPQTGASAEKELFQLSIKQDLDGDGREEWYVVTLSLKTRALLRLKLDKFVMKVGRPRCVPFVFYPRRNSVYGYSYAGDKLLTLAEEHTALRNMVADRSALATNAPVTVLQGALWDPNADPIGVGSAITVRSHDEVKQLQISDVPQSVIFLIRDVLQAKERVGGLSDMAVGVQSAERRTLGENKLVSAGSAVRVKEPVGHFRRAIAEVMKLRHAIWVETLEADSKGLEAPADVLDRLSMGGHDLPNGRFTAEQLKGKFRFKPYGSVDTADAGMRMQYFNQGFIALGNMAKMFPMLQMVFQNPEIVVRTVQEWARVYKIRDVNVFLKALQPPQQPALPAASGMSGGDPMTQGQPGEGGGLPPELAQMMAALGGGGNGGDEFAQY